MALLHYLSYGGAVVAFIFVTLSLASGLLWLSELIEEHARLAKTIGQRGIYTIITIHILLYISDSLPPHLILFSIACHIVYLQNFTPNWPMVSLNSVTFLSSCLLVITDHFLWFFHFAKVTQDARQRARSPYRAPRTNDPVPGFADIATFFGICIWLAPLFLFLSLSANDNALPVNLTQPGTPTSPSKPVIIGNRGSLFKKLVDALPLDHLPRLRPKPRRKDTTQGIIAPPSPSPRPIPSPLPSPSLHRAPSTGNLHRVPSMTNLPPPKYSGRLSSSDSKMLSPDNFDPFQSPSLSPSFAPSTPPQRVSGTTPTPTRRITTDGRLERRAVSAMHPDHSF